MHSSIKVSATCMATAIFAEQLCFATGVTTFVLRQKERAHHNKLNLSYIDSVSLNALTRIANMSSASTAKNHMIYT